MHQHPHTRRWRNLSKAMMLADDTKINDPSIVSQIEW